MSFHGFWVQQGHIFQLNAHSQKLQRLLVVLGLCGEHKAGMRPMGQREGMEEYGIS
jgi:hypothetical protein